MSDCVHCGRKATHEVTDPPKRGPGGIRHGDALRYDVCEGHAETYPERYVERIPSEEREVAMTPNREGKDVR